MMNPIENQQLCAQCLDAFSHGSARLDSVPGLVKRIIKTKAWTERKIATGKIIKLKSFRDLIVLPPLDGWGENPEKLEAIIRDDVEALTLWREQMTPPNHRPISHDNVITSKQGNSRAYTLSRLKVEEPKLFEEVKAGRMSANAAAIKAGFRKKLTVCEQIEKLFKKATPSEQKKIINWILAQ